MASSVAGWTKVAVGLRLVASATATNTCERATTVAKAAALHGVDLTSKLCAVSGVATSSSSIVSSAASVANSTTNTINDMTPRSSHGGVNGTLSVAITNNPVDRWNFEKGVDAVGGDNIVHERSGDNNNTLRDAAEESSTQTSTDDSVSKIFSSQSITPPEPSTVATAITDTTSTEPLEPPTTNTSSSTAPPPSRFETGTPVPSSRLSRALSFSYLGIGLAAGTAAEFSARLFSPTSESHSAAASAANANRLAASLCRMRGAALKLGQMLSIQDETLLPPTLVKALETVRQGADAMPREQLEAQLVKELGKNWRDSLEEFDYVPFAAASIGQVHRARLKEGRRDVVMKVQYPGVADSIESDLGNLSMVVRMSGLAPKGLFLEKVMRVGRDELKVECDYLNEAQNQKKFQKLIFENDTLRNEGFVVPHVVDELTTAEVLTSEYVPGGTIDKVSHLSQTERNRVARNILRLTLLELFSWRFMQTDPNWGNFLYDVRSRKTSLIDFGAARSYEKKFVDKYLQIVWAAANRDEETLMRVSKEMGFLTGEEGEEMVTGHRESGFTVGEPFATQGDFDFRGSDITRRIGEHGAAFLEHRLTPPPEEVYTLHRKIAGAYNLCIKLEAVIPCRDLLEDVMKDYIFDDDNVEDTVADKIEQ